MSTQKDMEAGFSNIGFDPGEVHDDSASENGRRMSTTSSDFGMVGKSKSARKYRIRRASADNIPRSMEYRIRKALGIIAMIVGIGGLAIFFIVRHSILKHEHEMRMHHHPPHPPIEGHHFQQKTTPTMNLILNATLGNSMT